MVMLPALCATTTYVMVQVFFCDDTPLMLWNSNPVEVVGPARISRPSNDGGVKDMLRLNMFFYLLSLRVY